MARPQEQPGIGHPVEQPARAFEFLCNARAPRVEALANARDMLAEMAADEHFVNDALGERRRRHRHQQLHPRQCGDRVGTGGDETHAQARRQRLAVAAEVERPLQPIECREARRRVAREIREDVVLDDVETVLRGELQQAVRDRRLDMRARRIVQHRHREVRLGLVRNRKLAPARRGRDRRGRAARASSRTPASFRWPNRL